MPLHPIIHMHVSGALVTPGAIPHNFLDMHALATDQANRMQTRIGGGETVVQGVDAQRATIASAKVPKASDLANGHKMSPG